MSKQFKKYYRNIYNGHIFKVTANPFWWTVDDIEEISTRKQYRNQQRLRQIKNRGNR